MHNPLEEPTPVPDGEIVLVSPSQINTFSCPAKWGFGKLHGLRSSSKAAEFGSEVHAVREKFLATREPIDQTTKAGQVAATGLAEILDTTKSARIEYNFTRRLSPSLAWQGIIDVFDPFQSPRPRVSDHKTTGSPRWVKSEAALRADPQWNIYADFALNHLDVESVSMWWLYVTTKKPFQSMPRKLVVDFLDGYRLEQIAKLENVSKEIEAIRRAPPQNANELPKNTKMCGAFGGCPFTGKECSASVFAQIGRERPRKETTMSDFKEKLAAFRAKQQAKTDPVNPSSEDSPEPEQTEDKPKRGRPAGSKNKSKEPEILERVQAVQTDVTALRGDLEEMKQAIEALLEALS